jgi:hypothetical protein
MTAAYPALAIDIGGTKFAAGLVEPVVDTLDPVRGEPVVAAVAVQLVQESSPRVDGDRPVLVLDLPLHHVGSEAGDEVAEPLVGLRE